MSYPNDSDGPNVGGEEGAPTFALPHNFPGADQYKEGDTISLKVVAQGESGLMVKCIPSEGEAAPDAKPDAWEGLDEHMQGAQPQEQD